MEKIIEKRILIISFLLIIILFVSFGIVTIIETRNLATLTKTIYEHPLTVSNAALRANLNLSRMQRSMKDVQLSSSPTELNNALDQINKRETVVYEQLNIIKKNILGEEGQALEKETRELFVGWKPLREKMIQLYKFNNKDKALLIAKEKNVKHGELLENKMQELNLYAREKAGYFMALSEKSQKQVVFTSIVLTLLGAIISIFITIFTVNKVNKEEEIIIKEKNDLQKALDEIKTLRGIIPICSYCKQIRDDKGLWNKMEEYIRDHSEAEFSHGICPECCEKIKGIYKT